MPCEWTHAEYRLLCLARPVSMLLLLLVLRGPSVLSLYMDWFPSIAVLVWLYRSVSVR